MAKRYLTFSECDFTFGDNSYTFDEVFILEQAELILNGAVQGDDGEELERKLSPTDLEKLIRVVAKINGISYEEVKSIKKGKITINTSEIKIAINKLKKGEITII